ncbi:MAG: acetate--CoA ligase family protein [Haloferacaceae archaeon]
MTDLSGLFDPDRVAVVGATDREGSVGRALLANLSTFDGEVIPVNPNRETVMGTRCYPSIGAVPDASSVDLAVVVVPAPAAVDVVRQIGEAGVGNVVVITAGFGETGERGAGRERDLIAVAERYDLDLVGPNCVGVISTPTGLNATFLRDTPPEGSISLVSQSGAFIAAVLGWAAQRGIGFKDVVSLGNEAVLDEVDFLVEWGTDPETDVILAYLEDVDEGRRFIDAAREVTTETPVVVIKSGRTEAGARAAASHTGSIAGSDQAYRAGLRQAGALRYSTVQEVFDASRVLAGQPSLDRDGIAVVTNGGGPGVLTADALGESRLELAEFGDGVRAALADLLPAAIDVTNPLDLVGDAGIERYRRALDVVLDADGVGGAVVLASPTAMFEFDDLAEVIGESQRRAGKPVLACLMGGAEADRAAAELQAYGVPSYFDPARAVAGLEALADYRDVTERVYDSPATFDVDRRRAREVLSGAIDRGVEYLGVEAMDLLDAYGIPTPAGALAESEAEAEAIAREIDGPVVMKIASPDVVHKSDVGGVEVGVPVADVREVYRAIHGRAREHDPDATVLGVRVEEFVDPGESTETIVGVNRDPQFGHLLMFGLGGIFVQIFEDTSFRVAPVSEREAREMTTEIRAAPMLRGARGRTPADVDAVVETIQRISQLVGEFPAITELDVNPLVAAPDGVRAVDLRLTVDREELAASLDAA